MITNLGTLLIPTKVTVYLIVFVKEFPNVKDRVREKIFSNLA